MLRDGTGEKVGPTRGRPLGALLTVAWLPRGGPPLAARYSYREAQRVRRSGLHCLAGLRGLEFSNLNLGSP